MQLLFVAELPVTPLGGGVLPAALRGSSQPAPAPSLARVPAPPPPSAGWQESVPGGPSANAESFIRAEGSLAGASSPRVHQLPEALGRVYRLISSVCVCVCVSTMLSCLALLCVHSPTGSRSNSTCSPARSSPAPRTGSALILFPVGLASLHSTKCYHILNAFCFCL